MSGFRESSISTSVDLVPLLHFDGGGLRGHKGRVSNRQQQKKHMNGWMAFDGSERRTKKDQ